MRVNMKLPNKSGIHIVEHYCGNYWGSCSFLLDLAAFLANPERIIILSHKDIDASYFIDEIKKRFLKIGKGPEDIGRLLCVGEENIEEQLFHQEMGLYPGMEMVVLVTGSGLSGVLKYLYNSGPDMMKWVSVVVSVQCGFKRSFVDILRNEYAIGSCLTNGYLDTFVHVANEKPHTISGKEVTFNKDTVGDTICKIYPIASVHTPPSREMVDTLSS